MIKGLSLRKARSSDSSRVAALCGELGYPITRDQARRRLRAILGCRTHSVWVAVNAAGEVVGWNHVFRVSRLEVADQAELGGLVVDSRVRGRGVGRRLVDEAEKWARRRGCRALRVRTNVLRRGAHRFYRGLGYRLVKTQRVYQRELDGDRR